MPKREAKLELKCHLGQLLARESPGEPRERWRGLAVGAGLIGRDSHRSTS